MVTVLPVSQIGTPSSAIQPGLQESGDRGLNGRTSRRRGCHLHRMGYSNQVGGLQGQMHRRNSDGTGVLGSGPLHVGSPLRDELRADRRVHHHGSGRHGHHGGRSIQRAISPRQLESAESVGTGRDEVTQGLHRGLHHRRHHRSHSPNAMNNRANHLHPSERSDRSLSDLRGRHHHRTHSPDSLNNFRAHGHSSRRHGIRSSTGQPESELGATQLGNLSLDS